jgi:UDP-N-acetylglucosamine/UDP-N-acetylgalactosamine 4-epimerase
LSKNPASVNTVYNVAYGENTSLNELYSYLTEFLTPHKTGISGIKPTYGPARKGDVLHSLASIEKAKELLGYNPQFNIRKGLQEAIEWYVKNL